MDHLHAKLQAVLPIKSARAQRLASLYTYHLWSHPARKLSLVRVLYLLLTNVLTRQMSSVPVSTCLAYCAGSMLWQTRGNCLVLRHPCLAAGALDRASAPRGREGVAAHVCGLMYNIRWPQMDPSHQR
jgi:branched-subunit amino acid transport protein